MVLKKDSKIVSDNIRKYLDPMSRSHLDVININSGNKLEHELMKTEICYKLLQRGHTFVTEAKLKTGKRPDILVLDLKDALCYEIMCSEKEESLSDKNKQENYMEIQILPVRIDKR